MATVVKNYLLDGASYRGYGTAPLEQIDIFEVTGCRALPFLFLDAVTASGLPGAWTTHPAWGDMLRAVSYDVVRVISGEQATGAIVAVRFVNVQPQIYLRGGAGLRTISTDMDRLRNPVMVSNYNPTPLVLNGVEVSPAVDYDEAQVKAALVDLFVPDAVISVQRVMPSVAYGGFDPATLQTTYVGTTNSQAWFRAPPGTLLCESVSYNNDEFPNVAWNMTFEFRYKPLGWNPEAVWLDSETGLPGINLLKAPGFDVGTVSDNLSHHGRKIVDRCLPLTWNVMLA